MAELEIHSLDVHLMPLPTPFV